MSDTTYTDLNAELNIWGENGEVQLDKDKQAARAYFLEHVNPNTVFFHNLREKADYLIENNYWDPAVVDKYGFDRFKELMKHAYSFKFRFPTFVGAYKFYTSYALKNSDGDRYLERFEDRVVLTAITYSSSYSHAKDVITEIMEGRFQPATPTFLNAGRANAGGPVSCFILKMDDNMESISRGITDSLQLSKRGGGVGNSMTDIRETGAPIKNVNGQASGLIPIMKLLENSFSYANQLGQRQGSGVVYLNAHHPDVMGFLDTKRENADEKIRIKTLSLGLIIPDITFELAKNNEEMYLFSPYDVERVTGKPLSQHSVTERYREWVEDERISKTKINARKFFQTIAEVQFESGYPYLMFEDAANRANPAPNVGRIVSSNLCSEIFQPQRSSEYNEDGSFSEVGQDVSCNLGSLNVARVAKLSGKDFEHTVKTAYRFLNNVAVMTRQPQSPSIDEGNSSSRAIGLGQMNLHGALIEMGLDYDSDEARQFFFDYMHDITYCLVNSSADEAVTSGPFVHYEGSRWENGEMVTEYRKLALDVKNSRFVTDEEGLDDLWEHIERRIEKFGVANQHLQAIPPTGSISYINHSTSSIHPVTSPVEIRKEGKLGRVYYPAYGLTGDNLEQVKTAYDYGYRPLIDMYKQASGWVDQGMSMTLFFKAEATTRDVNRAQVYAHKAGVKSIYYIRLSQKALEGTSVNECVSCTL